MPTKNEYLHLNEYLQTMTYCGIIRIRGGSILVEFKWNSVKFSGTSHLRIYILNEMVSEIFNEHLKEKRNRMQVQVF